MQWLATLHFANIFGFALAAFSPLLVLAYLRRKPKNPRVVSSVIILKTLQKRVRLKKKVKLPPNFYLELLAILLLTTAAAYPLYRSEKNAVLILCDNSLSMRAAFVPEEERKTQALKTRYDEARRLLGEWLTIESADHTYSLYLSSPELTQLGSDGLTGKEVLELLRTTSPTLTGDKRDASFDELAASGKYDKVLFVTDRLAEFVDDRTRDSGRAGSTPIEVLTVRSPQPNVFLSGIRLKENVTLRGARKIVVTAGASSASPIDAQLDLYEEKSNNTSPIMSTTVTLVPNIVQDISFDLPSSLLDSKLFRVDLKTQDSSQSAVTNALGEDDSAWIATDSSGVLSVLFVTDEKNNRFEHGLDSIRGFEITAVTAREFGALEVTDLAKYHFALFYRTAPPNVSPIASLFVLPPEENEIFPVMAEVREPRITSWLSDHPLTSYLRVPLLSPQAALVFNVPNWARSVLNVERGSIVAAGERAGGRQRVAAVGFEILPFEGRKTPVLSVLMLNLVRWLTGSTGFLTGALSGTYLTLEGEKSWVIRKPSGAIDSLETTADLPSHYQLDEPGIYKLTSISGDSEAEIVKSVQTVPVNTFYPAESSTFESSLLTLPRRIFHTAQANYREKSHVPVIVAIVLFILLIEFFVRQLVNRRDV